MPLQFSGDGALLAGVALLQVLILLAQLRILRKQQDTIEAQGALQKRMVDVTADHYERQKPRLEIPATGIMQTNAEYLGVPGDDRFVVLQFEAHNVGAVPVVIGPHVKLVTLDGAQVEMPVVSTPHEPLSTLLSQGMELTVAGIARCQGYVVAHENQVAGRGIVGLRIEVPGLDPVERDLPFLQHLSA